MVNTVLEMIRAEILANPDLDLPRMVYADWLEDHGNASDQAYAEFIRVQLELKALSGQRVSDRERYLRQQEASLLDAHPEWFANITSQEDILDYGVQRGFLSGIVVGGNSFLNFPFHALFREHPLEAVEVIDWSGYEQQISSAIPKELRTLILANSDQLTTSEAVALVSYSKHTGWENTLKELVVQHANWGGEDRLLQDLPRQRLRINGYLWSPQQANENRLLLEAPQQATQTPSRVAYRRLHPCSLSATLACSREG